MKLVAELGTPGCISSRNRLLPEGRRQRECWPTQQVRIGRTCNPFPEGAQMRATQNRQSRDDDGTSKPEGADCQRLATGTAQVC